MRKPIQPRLTFHQRAQLLRMNFRWMVVVEKDVSVVVVGAVVSVFAQKGDADKEAERLCGIYGVEDAYMVREI